MSGDKDKQREEEARQRRVRLFEQLRASRDRAVARVRTRSRQLVQLFVTAVVLLFAATALSTRAELTARLDGFHHLCLSIRPGDPIEAVRGIASERRLELDYDGDESRAEGRDIFLLRPEPGWPARLSCRFEAREARLFPIRK